MVRIAVGMTALRIVEVVEREILESILPVGNYARYPSGVRGLKLMNIVERTTCRERQWGERRRLPVLAS